MVILYDEGGYFVEKNKSSKFNLSSFEKYPYYSPIRQNFLIKKNSIICDSICLIDRCTPCEKEKNKKYKTGVRIKYKNDVNKEIRW